MRGHMWHWLRLALWPLLCLASGESGQRPPPGVLAGLAALSSRCHVPHRVTLQGARAWDAPEPGSVGQLCEARWAPHGHAERIPGTVGGGGLGPLWGGVLGRVPVVA